ncbi:MAG: hypothetical protein H0W23_01565, partial [Chloroflexia bacterium]|nr:hypothetical protein [Chloroflexia bacterium]
MRSVPGNAPRSTRAVGAGGNQSTYRGSSLPPDPGDSIWTSPANISTEINGIGASLADVDPRSAARLRDLGHALTSEDGRQRWSDVDLSRAFNTDRLSYVYALRREGGFAPASIEVADKIRNVLVLVPIVLTWAALAEAS